MTVRLCGIIRRALFLFSTIDNDLCMAYNMLCKRLHDFTREVDEDGCHNQ